MFSKWKVRLRSLLFPSVADRDLDEELRFHLDRDKERNVAGGMTPDEASLSARRSFGNLALVREEARDALGTRLVGDLRTDVRYALRVMTRSPGLAVVTTLTLTLGIGANAVMFGVVDQLLLRPPAHVANAAELRHLYFHTRDEDGALSFDETTSYPVIVALHEQVSSFADVVGSFRSSFILGRGAHAEPIDIALVDGSYFAALGVHPVTGRFFAADESRIPNGAHVAVIGDRFRLRHFGRTVDPIGTTILLEDQPFTVIGVLPAGFTGIDRGSNIDAWVPLGSLAALKLGADWHSNADVPRLHALVRLRDPASSERSAIEATQVYRRVMKGLSNPAHDTLGTVVLGSINSLVEPGGMSADAKTSIWLMGVAVIVLLVAVANVANLLVARAVQRRRETAVRLALGVSRGRLLRQLMSEALVLATIAVTIALIASAWASKLMQELLLPGFVWSGALIDLRVLAFTVVVMVFACVLAGLAPSLYGIRTDVNHALKAGAREWTGSRSSLRSGLLMTQTVLCVVLLVGSGLFVRSLSNVRNVDVGIDLDHVMITTTNLERVGLDSARQRVVLETVAERLRQMPSVAGATVVAASTPTRVGVGIKVGVPGTDTSRTPENGGPYVSVIDSSFLPVLGTRVIQGRPFISGELRTTARVAIVNETTAEFYWPGDNPLGKCVILAEDDTCTEIVGVVQPIMFFRIVNEPKYAQLFIPPRHPAAGNRARTLMLRARSEVGRAAADARQVFQEIIPNAPYVAVRSIADAVSPQIRPWRLGATMFGVFGFVALAIAAVGLYSVMAYWVTQRRYEFGVRMALGARPGSMWRLVAKEATRTIGIGLAIGLAIAALAAPRAADMLYRTSPRDIGVYAAVAALLALAALMATIVPTYRATHVDSAKALRAE